MIYCIYHLQYTYQHTVFHFILGLYWCFYTTFSCMVQAVAKVMAVMSVFPMQPHRRVFVPPPGFGGPHSRALPTLLTPQWVFMLPSPLLPTFPPPCLPQQGHTNVQGPGHHGTKMTALLSCPPLSSNLCITCQQSDTVKERS